VAAVKATHLVNYRAIIAARATLNDDHM